MGAEIRLEDGAGHVTAHTNRPSHTEGYPTFRRVVARLSAIQDRHALNVEPLHCHYSWALPADSVTPEAFESTYKRFSLTHDPERQEYRVTRRINGRVIITNYDPSALTNDERFRLHEEAEQAPANDILMDIRPGHTGGEFPCMDGCGCGASTKS
jgi:hypothetical protein